MENLNLWIGFIAGVSILLALDMGVFQRKAHTVSLREAALWTTVWFSLAMLFAAGIFVRLGKEMGVHFLTGYLIEYSLSVDNVFLFAVIFRFFQVPVVYQKRVLYWGILSAVFMRGVMIAAGSALIERFAWVNYIFGVFLIYTGWKMFQHRAEEPNPGDSAIVRFMRRRFRILDRFEGQNFFVMHEGKRYATLLLLVLAVIEVTDVLFALDSIPAIFGITTDAFIVFTSNILAILGLRSLYFLLSGVMDMFQYLTVGLSGILGFVGIKMIVDHAGLLEIPGWASLLVIGGILGVAIIASILKIKREKRKEAETTPSEASS